MERSKLHVCTHKAIYYFAPSCLSAFISYPEIHPYLHHYYLGFSFYPFHAQSSLLPPTLVISQRSPGKTTTYLSLTCFKSSLHTDICGESPMPVGWRGHLPPRAKQGYVTQLSCVTMFPSTSRHRAAPTWGGGCVTPIALLFSWGTLWGNTPVVFWDDVFLLYYCLSWSAPQGVFKLG